MVRLSPPGRKAQFCTRRILQRPGMTVRSMLPGPLVAVLGAALFAGSATAQTPDSFQPDGPEETGTAADTGNTTDPGIAADTDIAAGIGIATDTTVAALGEEDTPAFPPGLDPIIAVHPLNPRLNQAQPWQITDDGRVIPQRRAPRPPIPVFRAPLTDAFSSRSEDGIIELTFGGQTSLGGTLGMRVSRLETAPASVGLTVGESLALDDLTVRAFDEDGELVERAPLRLEIEGPEGFVDMTAFDEDKRTLAAVARGIGRIWITSLLPTRQDEPYSIPVVLVIREPGSQGARMSTRIHENVPASP